MPCRSVTDADAMDRAPRCSVSGEASPNTTDGVRPADPLDHTCLPSRDRVLATGLEASCHETGTPSAEAPSMKSPFTSPPGTGAVMRRPGFIAWIVRRPSLTTV